MKTMPWESCSVVFGISNRENVWDLNDGRLPEGWKVVSTRPIGPVEASFIVTFSVSVEPSFEDGEKVKGLLREVGAL